MRIHFRGVMVLLVLAFFSIVSPVFAATNWTVLDESTPTIIQVDRDKIRFSDQEKGLQLDVWVRTYQKSNNNSYLIARYLVREDLSFIMLERTMYASNGTIMSSFQNTTNRWMVATPDSPVGIMATRLYAEHKNNPQAFQAPVNSVVESADVTYDAEALKIALEEKRIKSGIQENGGKWFFVRDTKNLNRVFFDGTHVKADFYKYSTPSNATSKRLNFLLADSRAGSHSVKEYVILSVDDLEWKLAPPLPVDVPGSSRDTIAMSFNVPESLSQAILATKGGITVKWMHQYGKWEEEAFVIPNDVVRDIQLMYLGCR